MPQDAAPLALNRFAVSGPEATARLAAALAAHLRPGDVIGLSGDLGAGKTSFVRAALSALGHDGAVPSPSFTLAQFYALALGPVWHFDLYRLKAPEEVFELGWDEALETGLCFVEWPERAGPHMPADALTLSFQIVGSTERLITAHGPARWAALLDRLALEAA